MVIGLGHIRIQTLFAFLSMNLGCQGLYRVWFPKDLSLNFVYMRLQWCSLSLLLYGDRYNIVLRTQVQDVVHLVKSAGFWFGAWCLQQRLFTTLL